MRKINALYDVADDPTPSALWEGSQVVQKLPEVPQSAYQKSLDTGAVPSCLTPDQVRYWSDFSRVFFHPKSLNQLYDYELDSNIRPFDNWSLGQELFQSLDREQDIVDRDFRPFVEEADQMQGLALVPHPSGGHTLSRYYHDAFPLADSFPPIYRDEDGAILEDFVGVTTRLSTDSSISTAVRDLRSCAVPAIELQDREDVDNELAELAEAYRIDWSSGSDDGDDGD